MKTGSIWKRVAAAGCAAVLCSCSPAPNGRTIETDGRATSDAVVETIRSRRSIRRYSSARVGRDTRQRILECGIWAPNGQGRESWQIRVADSPRLLAELDSLYGAASNRKEGTVATPRPAAYRAPVVLFVACDESYDLSQVDCGLWGGNVMLAAHSMGLGTCCLGGIARFLNSPDGAPFLRRLDLPATHRLLYAIALGYPAESPAPKGRDTSKIVFLE